MSDPALLHIYAQDAHHEPAYIVGNQAGLGALRDALNDALGWLTDSHTGEARVFTADGEGFEVYVRLLNGSWQAPPWTELHIGYTAPHPQEQGERRSLHPWRLWKGEAKP